MSKTTPKKPHAPKRRRRVRRSIPGVWGVGNELDNILETLAGMALLDMVRKAGFRPSQILLTINMLAKNKPPTTSAKCVCGGECLCHTGVQIAAVPCPPGCPNIGTRLDGCHRCDCGGYK